MLKIFASFVTLTFIFISLILIIKEPKTNFFTQSPGVISNNLSDNESTPLPSLSLERIFSADHQFVEKLPKEKLRTLIATGDIIPARSVNFQTTQRNDFTWAFNPTAEIVRNADLTFINLESPLIKNCPVTQEGMIFCGDERHIEGLITAGVDVVNLANNHAGNYGFEGIENTANLLKQGGITVTGRSGAKFKEIRGIKFAFLGYNDIGSKEKGLSWAEEDKVVKEIQEAKKQAGVVIVTFHWGVEYVSQPTERQKNLAHLAVDSGADLIIGNHPHWIQPVEVYNGRLITYAHGNYIFDQMWSRETREGVMGKYTFYDNRLVDAQFFPVYIQDFGQAHFLTGEQGKVILDKMKNESLKLAGSD